MAGDILVVDDDETFRGFLKDTLEICNYTVTVAEDFDSALERLSEQSFNLVISDMNMPGKSGFDLLTEVISNYPELPMVIATGLPKIDAAVHCMKVGAFDYISKPIDIEQLQKIVKLGCQRSLLESQIVGSKTFVSANTRTLAGYTILETIGEGTMGIVFLVEKTGENNVSKYFALKIIKKSISEKRNKRLLRRFFNEIEIVTRVNHPNIVSIVEHGYADDAEIPYFVMEHIGGESLKAYCEGEVVIDLREKVSFIRQIASALSVIHRAGVWHRDIKPENILITMDGIPKLSDFGIAHLPDSELTESQQSMGTPAYLSPEGFESSKVDHRSDIFSLGAVSYELLLGQKPFEADSVQALAFKIQSAAPIEACQIQADFPADLQAILEKMLMKNRDQRYQSVDEVVADLDVFLERQ